MTGEEIPIWEMLGFGNNTEFRATDLCRVGKFPTLKLGRTSVCWRILHYPRIVSVLVLWWGGGSPPHSVRIGAGIAGIYTGVKC